MTATLDPTTRTREQGSEFGNLTRRQLDQLISRELCPTQRFEPQRRNALVLRLLTASSPKQTSPAHTGQLDQANSAVSDAYDDWSEAHAKLTKARESTLGCGKDESAVDFKARIEARIKVLTRLETSERQKRVALDTRRQSRDAIEEQIFQSHEPLSRALFRRLRVLRIRDEFVAFAELRGEEVITAGSQYSCWDTRR